MASLGTTVCASAIGLLVLAGAAHAQNAQNEQKQKNVEHPQNTPVPLPTLPTQQNAPSPDSQEPTVKSDLPNYRPMTNNSQRQRDDSLAADRRRTSGELNPYPNAPIGMPAPAAGDQSAGKPSK